MRVTEYKGVISRRYGWVKGNQLKAYTNGIIMPKQFRDIMKIAGQAMEEGGVVTMETVQELKSGAGVHPEKVNIRIEWPEPT